MKRMLITMITTKNSIDMMIAARPLAQKESTTETMAGQMAGRYRLL
jgi:hypothetical protein